MYMVAWYESETGWRVQLNARGRRLVVFCTNRPVCQWMKEITDIPDLAEVLRLAIWEAIDNFEIKERVK